MKAMLAIAVSISAVLAIVAPAEASSSAVQITKIYFNSPGTDNRSNASLNAEYVLLKNVGSSARSLTNWTVRDASSHVYKFGSFTLGAGKSVYVHTGSGSNSSTHRYWGSGAYIWNNTGDTATLKNSSGSTVDSCGYSGSGSYVNC